MDFELSAEQRLLQETVRGFVEDRILPVAVQNDIEHRLDVGVIEGLAELGDHLRGHVADPQLMQAEHALGYRQPQRLERRVSRRSVAWAPALSPVHARAYGASELAVPVVDGGGRGKRSFTSPSPDQTPTLSLSG